LISYRQNCREEYGEHTCDKRNTLTYIRNAFPQFDIEDGFAEDDELWEADSRETEPHAAARAQTVLDRIFRDDKDVACAYSDLLSVSMLLLMMATVVSVTAHGGIINGFLHALGRPRYPLPTGGALFCLTGLLSGYRKLIPADRRLARCRQGYKLRVGPVIESIEKYSKKIYDLKMILKTLSTGT
jgi:xanthosine utilization system XapX-like protein